MSPDPPAGHYMDGSNTALCVPQWGEVEAFTTMTLNFGESNPLGQYVTSHDIPPEKMARFHIVQVTN